MINVRNSLGGGNNGLDITQVINDGGNSELYIKEKPGVTVLQELVDTPIEFPVTYSPEEGVDGFKNVTINKPNSFEGLYVWDKYETSYENTFVNNRNNIDFPVAAQGGNLVIHNGEPHLLGSNSGSTSHYKWDGTSWVSVSTLPYSFYYGDVVSYHGDIHLLGGLYHGSYHYRWDGSSWIDCGQLPIDGANECRAVIYNDYIYLFGNDAIARYNGSSWSTVTKPSNLEVNSSVACVVFNGLIHCIGSSNSSYRKKHMTFDGVTATQIIDSPVNMGGPHTCCVYEGKLYSSTGTTLYSFDGANWSEPVTIPSVTSIHALPSSYREKLIGINGFAMYNIYDYTQKYTPLSYVTSSNIDEFPDGGILNGYYYSRLNVVSGVYVPGNTTNTSIRISHGLGKLPMFFCMRASEHIKPTENNLYQLEHLSLFRTQSYAANGDLLQYWYGRANATYMLSSGPYWYGKPFRIWGNSTTTNYGLESVDNNSITLFGNGTTQIDDSSGPGNAPNVIAGREYIWYAIG